MGHAAGADMNKDRLLKLADFLDTVPDDRFDMHTWASGGFEPEACGTVACAAGWACTIFKDEGLHLRFYKNGPKPAFKELRGIDAVEEFFDLDYGQTMHLFFCRDYDEEHPAWVGGPNKVAEVIRAFVQ